MRREDFEPKARSSDEKWFLYVVRCSDGSLYTGIAKDVERRWAPATTIERVRVDLAAERSTEGFTRKKEAAARRREKAQEEYVEDFHGAVVTFLAFHASHADLADRLAKAVTLHATPVGSGTVARTKQIPVEQRAEAAVIAWLRHQTTAYDGMVIPRVKGKRREVRRMLAKKSKELLDRYRRGEPIPETCPLKQALQND